MVSTKCNYIKDGIKREQVYNVTSTIRKELLKEVGALGCILFWHLATRRSSNDVPLTDVKLCEELGGKPAGITPRIVETYRRKLIKSHYFLIDTVTDLQKKKKHITYYIGRTAVLNFKRGDSSIPNSVHKTIDRYILKELNKSNIVECIDDFLSYKDSILSDIAGWVLNNEDVKIEQCPKVIFINKILKV